MYIKNPLVLDKIQAAMNLLFDLKEEFDDYLDKSLFFQDPRVIEGWLLLAGEIKEIEIEDGEERDEKWEQRSEPYAASLLARRDLFIKYKGLYRAYYDPLYNLWMNYTIDGECISADAAEALKADHYEKILQVEDFDKYLEEVNSRSHDARHFANKTLTYILHIMQAIMDKAGQTVIDLKPSDEDFAKAIDDDLRGWTRAFGKEMLRDMKECLLRRFKKRITDDNRYELWCEMLRSDEDAIKKAMKQELAICTDETQDHWGVDRKEQMDNDYNLMRLIFYSCYTEELFDFGNVENVHPFIAQLTLGNLDMFYDIIVRRSLIQCEMSPELKTLHEEWLNIDNERPEEAHSSAEKHEIPKDELNFFAPKKNLQELLKGKWFAEVRTDEKYNSTWTDNFIEALMASDYGEGIARDWAVTRAKGKKNQLKGYVVGLLKDLGVLKGSYDCIAGKIAIMDNSRTFSNYMSRGKEQPYADWVKEYVSKSIELKITDFAIETCD